MRKTIMDLLKNNGYKVYSIGQVETPQLFPYTVVLMSDNSAIENPYGSKQVIEILCYVPDTSIFPLDEMVNNIQKIITEAGLADEFKGIGTDFHDTDLGAYMRNIKFQVPKANYI